MTDTSNLPLRSFVNLKPLAGVDSSQLAASFDQMAKSLQGASLSGVVRFTLLDEPQTQSFVISLHGKGAKVESEAKKVDFEVITSAQTWLAIAEGKLAPLDAFTKGEMRVRGDYKLGIRIMKVLAASGGRVDLC